MTEMNTLAKEQTGSKTAKDRFLAELDQLDGVQLPRWFQEVREAGAARVRESEFPHHKEEDWRFTSIKPILRTPFTVAKALERVPAGDPALEQRRFPEEAAAELVFVNGHFAPALSKTGALPEGVTVISFRETGSEHEGLLGAHLDKYVTARPNMFTALNSAFFEDGAFVHIDEDVKLDRPVHLIHLSAPGQEPLAAFGRMLVVAEANSQLRVAESHFPAAGANVPYLNNAVTEMVLGEGATMHHYKVTEEASEAFHMAGLRIYQEQGSVFRSHNITLSGRIVRHDLSVELQGEDADCQLNGLYLTDNEQLVDNYTSIDHAEANCTSWIGYKGVLDGHSHGVFTGHVMVRPDSQKTDSNQLNSNMLLSENATIDTKPQLEIFADDVKCTHGSTTGGPHERVIFYFRTRGMTEAMARGMLTYGFASDVVDQIDIEPLRHRLDRWVFDRYSPERHVSLPEKE